MVNSLQRIGDVGYMAVNMWRWICDGGTTKIGQNGQNWPKHTRLAKNRQKWQERPNLTKIDQNGQNWPKRPKF